MKTLLKPITLILLVMCLPLTAFGDLKVVDPINGSDLNPGTPEAPWKTLIYASQMAQPGDQVMAKPGVYIDWINPHNDGSLDHPITFFAEEPHTAKIVGMFDLEEWAVDHWTPASVIPETNIWKRTLKKWNFAEAYRDGERMPAPLFGPAPENLEEGMSWVEGQPPTLHVWLESGATPFDVQDWEIAGSHGVLVAKRHIVVSGFDISQFAREGVLVSSTKKVKILNNICKLNGRTGIAVNYSDKVLVEGNHAEENGGGMGFSSGISVYKATGHEIMIKGNVSCFNLDNSSIHSDGNGFMLDWSEHPDAGATFINNVAVGNSGSGFRIYGSSFAKFIHNTSVHNVTDPGMADWAAEMSIYPLHNVPIAGEFEISNNIFQARPGKLVLSYKPGMPLEPDMMDYNCYYASNGAPIEVMTMNHGRVPFELFRSHTGLEAHSLTEDPMLFDFWRLPSLSPVIDQGKDQPDVLTDIEGDSRPQYAGYDMGADEYIVSAQYE